MQRKSRHQALAFFLSICSFSVWLFHRRSEREGGAWQSEACADARRGLILPRVQYPGTTVEVNIPTVLRI